MGIGNYVHLHGKNYQKFGISQQDTKSISATEAVNNAKQELKSLVSNSKINNVIDIETFLNDILNQRQTSLGGIEISQGRVNEMLQQFTQIIESKFPEFEANLRKLSLRSMVIANAGEAVNLGNNGRSNVQVRTIKNAITSLQMIRDDLVKQLNSKNGKIDNITSIEMKKNEVNNLIRSLNGIISRRGGHGYVSVKGHEEIFSSVREAIRSVQGPTMKDLGDLGELFVGYMLSAAAGTISENFNALIEQLEKDIVIGGIAKQKTVLSGFDKNFVNMTMLVEEMNKNENEDVVTSPNKNKSWTLEDGTIVSARSSQGTVDVSIQFPSEGQLQSIFGTDKLNASIKNYISGIQNGIHVLSGAPLLSLLMLVNTDFVNHYLNLIAQHEDINFSISNEIDETLKQAVAIRALTGARSLTKNNFNLSDIFVVNDAGRFKVRTSKQLFEKIEKDINNCVDISGLPNSPIPNKRVGDSVLNDKDAQIRITNLLASLYRFKISMSLKPNALT